MQRLQKRQTKRGNRFFHILNPTLNLTLNRILTRVLALLLVSSLWTCPRALAADWLGAADDAHLSRVQAAYARVEDDPVNAPYTLAWISDTQNYHGGLLDIFTSMTEFIAAQAEAWNIGYVFHTGDVCAKYDREDQYAQAKDALSRLGGLPLGILPGNHDMDENYKTKYYPKYFNASLFAGEPWFGGAYKDGGSRYDLITLGGTDFVVVHLGYPATNAQRMAWARDVFNQYADRVGILATHAYLHSHGTRMDIGDKLFEGVVTACPNVYLVLCGHKDAQDTKIDAVDDNGDKIPDRKVYQMVADYQYIADAPNLGGGGFIRFLQVDDSDGVLRMFTYSPYLGVYRGVPEKALTQTEELPIPWAYERPAEAAPTPVPEAAAVLID